MLIIWLIIFAWTSAIDAQWQLIWHDEFDGERLNLTKWKVTDGKDYLEGMN